jgi:hypothetical protein
VANFKQSVVGDNQQSGDSAERLKKVEFQVQVHRKIISIFTIGALGFVRSISPDIHAPFVGRVRIEISSAATGQRPTG